MKKHYLTPEVEYVSLLPMENITITMEDISNPFEAAVAEDEAAEETAREAALQATAK